MSDWNAAQVIVIVCLTMRFINPIVIRSVVGDEAWRSKRFSRAIKERDRLARPHGFMGHWVGSRLGDAIVLSVLIWGGFF